ncbi:relaxase/mobilization nuclease domain-containing protein [Kitasatospora sp. NBC_01287]|uniref:relaxase/mobilization nuclease domain-containing protein n=1 Tax=Kitasatospora sp. NBC_01287 TaxID=2903573 RepID=UPI002259574C|nr:mobilization protein [Kitasatospora sp. NBC_01287]MCX4751226.1 relaxase/mobilization nuclease domain-containing protein [Kitasatospora sp. NBC_01287]
MIPKIRIGTDRSFPLVNYLFGPGKHEEHTNQHLVASWNDYAPDPGPNPESHQVAKLADQLDQPVKALGDRAPAKKIWHCSVRTAPEDRQLDDTEWAAIARRIVHATGIAPEGDTAACRWVAVRHAPDHIHIAATLVRQDGRLANLSFDRPKAQAEARRIEKDYGLRQLTPGDGTAAQTPTSQERWKAERTGRTETPRETLRRAVRQAVAGAATEQEFLTRLREAGLRVKLRHAPSGDVLGYNVALPGDRNANQEPIWFSGSKLGLDLSLPRIRRRLADGPANTPSPRPSEPRTDRSAPARSRREAAAVAERAVAVLDEGDDEAGAQLVGAGELLDALAQTSPATTRAELRDAARAFERATRSHVRAENADIRALRSAARGIVHAGGALGRGEDGGTTAMVVSTLVLVALAAARWHSARGHAQQAAASRETADHLRAAYQQAATTPMRAIRDNGRALPEPERRRHEATIRAAIGEPYDQRGTSRKHDALAATLAEAEKAGLDPKALLEEATSWRELDTARDTTDVLVWRIRRIAHLPAIPAQPAATKAGTARTKPAPGRADTRTVPTTPARPATDPSRPAPRR